MSLILENILKISAYFIIIYILQIAIIKMKEKKKYALALLITGIILFGLYGNLSAPHPYSLDRENYALRFANEVFSNKVKASSLGLYYVEKVLHIFTYNPEVLFFTVAFLYILITLKAYKEYECDSKVFFILMLTSYGLYGFYMYKQCFAVALASLSFAYFTKKKYTKSIITLILAMTFHEAAWIVGLIFVCLIATKKSKLLRTIVYILMMLFVIFYAQINQNIIKTMIGISPSLGIQLEEYLSDEGGMIIDYNYFTIIKGMPFYMITLYGIIYRKKYMNEIENYDYYLFISIFTSLTIMLSLYMYWLWRFGTFFYLPSIVFFINLYNKNKDKKIDKNYCLMIKLVFLVLMLKLLIQYYYIYGGIV